MSAHIFWIFKHIRENDKMRDIAGHLIDLNVLIDSIKKTKRQNYKQTTIFAIIEILTPV